MDFECVNKATISDLRKIAAWCAAIAELYPCTHEFDDEPPGEIIFYTHVVSDVEIGLWDVAVINEHKFELKHVLEKMRAKVKSLPTYDNGAEMFADGGGTEYFLELYEKPRFGSAHERMQYEAEKATAKTEFSG